MIKVSAPGKIHLIGEHAVVYGEPAIIAAVGKRVFVEAEKSETVKIHFTFNEGEVYEDEISVDEVKKIGRETETLYNEDSRTGDFSRTFESGKGNKFGWVSIGYLMEKLGIESGVTVKIDQQIPLGSGMGSSSAYCVAVSMALSKLFDKDTSLETINRLAYELERFKHGTPSGGDNTACCYGGLIWFQKGEPNTIKPLGEEVPYKLDNFVLAYTKKPKKSTGELVSQVRSIVPEFRDKRVKTLGKCTYEMLESLKSKNFLKTKELINVTWNNLSELGLSIPEADILIARIKEIGGAAKLCGACGGGMMLSYHEDQQRLAETIRNFGYEPMEVELGVEGVRIDE